MQSEASNISVIVRVKPLLGDGSPSLFVEENSIRLVEPATIGTQCSWVGVRDFPETRFLFRTKVAAWYTAATGQWGCGYAGDAPDAADRIGCPAHSRQADRIHSRCVMMIVIVLGISLLPIFFSARFAHSFVQHHLDVFCFRTLTVCDYLHPLCVVVIVVQAVARPAGPASARSSSTPCCSTRRSRTCTQPSSRMSGPSSRVTTSPCSRMGVCRGFSLFRCSLFFAFFSVPCAQLFSILLHLVFSQDAVELDRN